MWKDVSCTLYQVEIFTVAAKLNVLVFTSQTCLNPIILFFLTKSQQIFIGYKTDLWVIENKDVTLVYGTLFCCLC